MGMGEAFTAVADDTHAIYYNPAGLAKIKNSEFISQYGELHIGLSDKSSLTSSFAAYGQKLGSYGGLALSWINFSLANTYQENSMVLGYGFNPIPKLLVGFSLKQLSRQYKPDFYTENSIGESGRMDGGADPVFSHGYSKGVFSSDLGLLYQQSRYSFGLMVSNLNQPNIAFQGEERLEAKYKVGMAYKVERSKIIDVDLINSKYGVDIGVGGEFCLLRVLNLRSGLVVGSQQLRNISLGASYVISGLRVDYAFVYPLAGIKDIYGSHRLGLSFQLGQLAKELRLSVEGEENKVEEKLVSEKAPAEKDAAQDWEEAEKSREAATSASHELEKLRAELLSMQNLRAEDPKKAILENYMKDFNQYHRKVSDGLSLADRYAELRNLLANFSKKGIDLSSAEKELKAIKQEKESTEIAYSFSLKYYREIIALVASQDERMEILKRIIDKYKPTGIEMTGAEAELQQLMIDKK